MDDLTGQIGICLDGQGFIPKGIEWATYSPCYHVVVAVDQTECVSAEPHGVRYRTNAAYKNIIWFRMALTDEDKAAIVAAANASMTLPYNYAIYPLLVLRRLTEIPVPGFIAEWLGRRRNVNCSQLTDNIYTAAGKHLFPGEYADIVTPGDFWRYAIKHGYVKAGAS